MHTDIDFEFEDLSPMIAGAEYGRGFNGTVTFEWDSGEEEYFVSLISLDPEAAGRPILNLHCTGTEHRQWFMALEHACRERFEHEIAEAAAEFRSAA